MIRASVSHPDRFIGIAAFCFAVLYALFAIDGTRSTVLVLIIVSAALACILTLQTLRYSPQLYAMTLIPDAHEIDEALQGLLGETKEVLISTLDLESTAHEIHRLEIIHELKLQISSLLAINSKRFCTVVLGFSPNTLISRFTKLQENRYIVGELRPDENDGANAYMDRKDLQSEQILRYCEAAIKHIEELQAIPLDWGEFTKICIAPSSSAALVRYVSLVSSLALASHTEPELTLNVQKLHRLQHALTMSSPHSLLFGATRLIRFYGGGVSQVVVRNRLALLELAVGLRTKIPPTSEKWWKNLGRGKSDWSQQISDTIMKQREEIWMQFSERFAKYQNGTEHVVLVDGYSRAVRTVLKHSVIDQNSSRIVFLSYNDEQRDEGLRLMAHEVLNEPPTGNDFDDWQAKCRGRVYFLSVSDIAGFAARCTRETPTVFHFVVGTGGIIAHGKKGLISRSRSKKELNTVIERLGEADVKTCVYAVGGAYKHKAVTGRFHENGELPKNLTEAVCPRHIWDVDEVISNAIEGPEGIAEYLSNESRKNGGCEKAARAH